MFFEDARQIDQLCDSFEAAWRQNGGRVQLETWLPRVAEPLRPKLFTELLAIDAQLRAAQQESLTTSNLGRPCIVDLGDDDFDLASRLFSNVDSQDETNQNTISESNRELTGHAGPSAASLLLRSLVNCPTFKGLSENAAAALESAFRPIRFAAGDPLMVQDEPSQGLFVVVTGRCAVNKRVEGDDRTIDECPSGSVLGEMSLLTEQHCTATIRAIGDVETLHLSVSDFHRLHDLHPELTIALSQLVSDRLGCRQIDALCGRTLGGYELIRSINRGGMGVIYEARCTALPERKVALKMLRHHFIHDKVAVRQFIQEASLLQSIEHDHLIAVRDSFVACNTRFLVMDLCDGEDLGQLLHRRGRFSEPAARDILGQIALGLVEVHRRGVVHLDLKPANVLVSQAGVAAIADFGLCQLLGGDEAAGLVRGTPTYMPPEQLLGDAVDYHADWYALGCVAYELVTGQRLFRGHDLVELLDQKRRRMEDLKWPVLRGVSEEYRKVIRNALHPNPLQRMMNLKNLTMWALTPHSPAP